VVEEAPIEVTPPPAEVAEPEPEPPAEEPAAAAAASGAGDAAEPEEEVDEEGGEPVTLAAGDPREHLNIVFIGHVDAGKSTLAGSLLFLTGHVDKRTIEKFEREAKDRNRESWYLAFIMDTNEEERAKGKTVEVCRAVFATENKRFTILDAPGHKSFVPNMIAGAAQADVGVLVISARRGEFETGFERGGQTREHAMLAKTLGVRLLIVVINKMDDHTVNWSKERYDECVGKLSPFLKSAGYNVAKHVQWVPISGLTGANILEPVARAKCGWYEGPTLLQMLDGLKVGGRNPDAPLRIPVLDKYSDRGTIAMGKVESGTVKIGQSIRVMPGNARGKVERVYINDVEVGSALPGENIKLKLKGVPEDYVSKGYVICSEEDPIPVVDRFQAQIMVTELAEHSLFTAGYNAVLHVHTCEEEVTVEKLIAEVDKKTGENKPGKPRFVREGSLCVAQLKTARTVCVETFESFQQLGRFTLRDAGRTIGIGKILRLPRADAPTGPSGGAGAAAGGAGSAPK